MTEYLDLRKLLALREVVQRGTIARAAEALHVTPSAVSQQLAALERAAGVPLVVRTNRGVRATSAGERLVERAEAILAELERADAELRASTGAVAGPVTVASFSSGTRGIVAPAVVQLRAQHPRLEPIVRELDPNASLPALASGALDVALTFGYDLLDRPAHRGCAFEHLLDEPMLLALPAASCGGGPLELADLAGEPWITAWPGSPCHETTIRACHRAGFEPAVQSESQDWGAILALVAAGLGVSLVPLLALGDVPDGVTIVPPAGEPVLRQIHAAYRRGGRRRPAVTATLDALAQAAETHRVPFEQALQRG